MGERPRVTVRLDENGGVAGLDIEGELDRDDLVEETPGKPTAPPPEEVYRPERFWGGV
ncbi:MAG TPA: hypothetical protein VG455_01560 [Acidimicrobiales bacterium]|nr:hypothetical protein [Acidimicrobiales bacterium]